MDGVKLLRELADQLEQEYQQVSSLLARVQSLEAEQERLRGLMQSLADRVAAQSALLSRRAEKEASQ